MWNTLASSLCCSIFRHGVKYWFGLKVYSSVFPNQADLNNLGWEVRFSKSEGRGHLSAQCVHSKCNYLWNGQGRSSFNIYIDFPLQGVVPFQPLPRKALAIKSAKQMDGSSVVRPSSNACWFVFSHPFSCCEGKEVEKGGGALSLWAITVIPWAALFSRVGIYA